MARPGRSISLLLALALLIVAWGSASAHPGQGEDVAYAHLKASQANGLTTVEVHILDPNPCDGFEASELVAERLGSTATGVIQPAGECSFEGAIELPEPGRWNLIVRLARDGKTAEASMPVGASDSAANFELETWFHSDATASDGFLPAWLDVQTIGLYAIVAVAALVLVIYLLRGRATGQPERA